jgi:hypothetical protein
VKLLLIALIIGLCLSQAALAQDGGTSGGGGYVSKNSLTLLRTTSRELALSLKRLSPDTFKNFPRGWTQAKYVELFENIRLKPLEEKQRDGADLIFDYGSDAYGKYIAAMRPYFHLYGAVPLKFEDASRLEKIKFDIKLKLLHESGHLLGLDENDSEEFSMSMLKEIESDLVACRVQMPHSHSQYARTFFTEEIKLAKGYSGLARMHEKILVNRPYGAYVPKPQTDPYTFVNDVMRNAQKREIEPGYLASSDRMLGVRHNEGDAKKIVTVIRYVPAPRRDSALLALPKDGFDAGSVRVTVEISEDGRSIKSAKAEAYEWEANRYGRSEPDFHTPTDRIVEYRLFCDYEWKPQFQLPGRP